MKLKQITINKKFIPSFRGNKDLPLEEQVVIIFNRIPGTSEKSNYKDFKFDSKGGVQILFNDQLLVSTFVDRVENLEVGEQKIKNGRDLANASCPFLTELFTEIRDYLLPDAEEIEPGEC